MTDQPLLYITGNSSKFATAHNNMQKYGINLEQKVLDVPEIQAETTLEVALDKAQKAFALVGQPLLVSDHGWLVAALNGFPGPYMKYMNEWLNPDNFLALMTGQQNREVVLRQNLIYIDKDIVKDFSYDIHGYLLHEASGTLGTHWDKIVCLTGDNKSVAVAREESGKRSVLLEVEEPWRSFANWYKEYKGV